MYSIITASFVLYFGEKQDIVRKRSVKGDRMIMGVLFLNSITPSELINLNQDPGVETKILNGIMQYTPKNKLRMTMQGGLLFRSLSHVERFRHQFFFSP